ncbi:hypothetical protein [Marinobacterium iners]|uniref:Uncharacterized protein n=1 Tax=Marinobacterium iners DSM 11526 TaxID=1122198 RepID=A0A1H3X318_9GAMM|nr:hypothetical protein [Marinobacterium iners]SDZ93786.1 hypothetical protein SAMN02745729_10125 [Marinobacterium iners DSM 11526]
MKRLFAAALISFVGSLPVVAADSPSPTSPIVMELIETIPELESWRQSNERLWALAVAEDVRLRSTPLYQDLSVRDRLLIVVNRVKKQDRLTVEEFPLYRLIMEQGATQTAPLPGKAAHEWIKSLNPQEKAAYLLTVQEGSDKERAALAEEARIAIAVKLISTPIFE